MHIPLNSSGLPKGLGSLQVRGRAYWAIYTDAFGRIQQVNTQTADIAEARQFLAGRAALVLQAKLTAVLEVLGETPGAGAAARCNHPAAGQAGSRGNGKVSTRSARAGRTNPRAARTRETGKREAQ